MKKIFLFAATAALFAACSSDNLSVNSQQQAAELPDGAVGFDVYTQKATTRAGFAGPVTTTGLKTAGALNNAGFGVFGYYTDNNEYEQRSLPNFMYNQQVNWSIPHSDWEYKPILYWPNEYGTNATSDDQDKLTFFAYAPWVDIIPTSGKVKNTNDPGDPDNTKELESYGIVSMTRNSTQGDPILKYIASFAASKSVDLCWGVADNGDGERWNNSQSGSAQTSPEIEDGKPWINLYRPASQNQRVKFTFKHATAQMRVNIDADIDVDGRGHTNEVDGKTRVWVREVTFKGFALKGSLNLNNDDKYKAKWLDYNGQNELVSEDVTIYDGRKDGKEGVNGAIATNEKTLGLNPALIQDGLYQPATGTDVYAEGVALKVEGVNPAGASGTDFERPGVTKQTVNLFAQNADNKSENGKGSIFHVIPLENEDFVVEIVYDIETVDDHLAKNLSDGATKGSSIENRITKEVTFGSSSKLQAGNSYTLNLHLGMNSVKFDAEVTPWIEEAAQDVDLPINVAQYAAGTNPTIVLPYTALTSYGFAISGLHGGENVAGVLQADATYHSAADTKTTDGANTAFSWTVTSIPADKNGIAIESIETTVNTTTCDRFETAKFTSAQSGTTTTVKFKQAAHPLDLKFKSATANTVVLERNAEIDGAFGWFCNGLDAATNPCKALTANDETVGTTDNHIHVWRNGTKLTWVNTSPSAAGTYTFGDASGVITFKETLKVGDIIKVELKTGDAPVETITALIAGISYTPATRTVEYRKSQTVNVVPAYVGSQSSPSISYESGATDVADNPTTDGQLTTKKAGTTTITATLSGDDQAVAKTATLVLTVEKQNSQIKYTAPTTTTFATTQTTAGAELIDLSHVLEYVGAKDADESAGTLTYTADVTKEGSATTEIVFDTNKLKVGTTAISAAGEYNVSVTATPASTVDYKYNASEAVTKNFTITVTATP